MLFLSRRTMLRNETRNVEKVAGFSKLPKAPQTLNVPFFDFNNDGSVKVNEKGEKVKV